MSIAGTWASLAAFCFLVVFGHTVTIQLQEPITYAHHYPDAEARPNTCKIVHNNNSKQYNNSTGYVPFIGTSIVRDSQLLVLRLFYSSLDFPVKHFVVVVPERAMNPPHGGMWYELQHLKDYAEHVVIITCVESPSVAEGWNAVFQAFPEEPWGVYCARDTAWTPGSLQKLAGHMWGGASNGSIELALMGWTFDIGGGLYNSFGMTRSAINRFGLFDENIYPAFFEDNDFQLRQARLQPPMQPKVLSDAAYLTGMATPDDPNQPLDDTVQKRMAHRPTVSGNYVHRKWGCAANGKWDKCAYQTPFNKSLPVWYWQTSKEQRQLDHGLVIRGSQLFDAHGRLIVALPASFAGWAGYRETAAMCRVTGRLGAITENTTELICI
ncbi:hypothetical protein COO60DRAFT_1557243 [Scenedesmus sp. NREL 46B-D3]|nr:hypothetical protein COO60DRAFT_1557243 [Scenedesmus sp. NREL 46B-D3]